MKKSLLFTLLLILSWQTQSQINKVETYQIGTQIDYYIGECDNAIPEAQGKLSFCDRAGNLAVVEESLGLNGRGTTALIPNYYNDSEVYVTRNGVSIYHSDGSWENIPNVAFQNPELTSFNNNGTVTNGVLLPDGKLLLHVNQAGFYVHTYDLITKEITLSVSTNTTGFGFPAIRNITYDTQTGKTYVFMVSGGSRYLFEYTETGFILLNESDELFFVFPSSGVATTVIKDSVLYVGSPSGLFAIGLDSPNVITKYDATDTGLLPFDKVNNFAIAEDGIFWLAQQASDSSAGGVTKFDIENETYEVYTSPNPGPSSVDILPRTIALHPDGTVHLTLSNYNAVADLDFVNGPPVWNFTLDADFDTFGVPVTYIPNRVYVQNGKTYYITNDFSSGNSTNYEALVRDGNSWTGRNDNAPGNISFWMIERFREAYPTEGGGSLWINNQDDIIVSIDSNDKLTSEIKLSPSGSQGALDNDQKYVGLISIPGEGSEVRKVISPTTYKYPSDNNGGSRIVAQYNDQIWVFNQGFKTIEVYIENTLIQSYDIDPAISLVSYAKTAVDRDGIFWALKSVNQHPSLVRFDRNTGVSTETEFNSPFGTTIKILPTPDGGIWLVSNTTAVFYKDGIEYPFTNDLFGSGTIVDGTIDSNGELHLFTITGSTNITTIQNPTSTDPIINSVLIAGNTGLLPTEVISGVNDIIIDSDGHYWINSSRGFYKIIDNDTTPFYRTSGITKGIVSGRLYGDVNSNGSYDSGEALAGISVALEVNGQVQNVITSGEGVYRIFAQEENTVHTLVVTSVADDFYLANRMQTLNVTTLDLNYENNDFILELKNYDALLYKQGQRTGVWGFERDGFDNTFTLAVTNMSGTKTFNELETTFLFENENNGELPEILDVIFTKFDPNGLILLHKYISINPRNNRWSLQGISPTAYEREEINLVHTTTEETGKRRVLFTIPAIEPRDTWVIEIKTALFDPVQSGTGVSFTTESIASPSFNDAPVSDNTFVLYPEDQRDYAEIPLPSEDPNNPYIDPLNPEAPGFSLPKEIYAPSPYRTNVYSSYDPNDKMVDGGAALEVNETDINRKWLTYTIRFENTGNFPAKDVYILDELEENILPDSFTLIEASNPVEVDFLPSSENLNRSLRFSFNNIFLPYDDENNDGWVKFRVRVKEDIAEETVVSNTAEIFFDQNPAIVTNTIQNLFRTPDVIGDTEAPIMVCQNITIVLDENGQATIVASDVDADSTDNEGIETLEVNITAFTCDNLGDNAITLIGTDASGNSASCTATVTVIDEFGPEVQCVAPFTITLDENGLATITVDQIDNGSIDNCGSTVSTLSVDTFTCDDIGANNVVFTVTDASGNAATCNVMVTVLDEITPVFDQTTLPQDQVIIANDAMQYEVEDFTAGIVFTDNCEVIIIQDPVIGEILETGIYEVTIIISDASGNAVEHTFEVIIDEALSLKDTNNLATTVYPNPTVDIIYVQSLNSSLDLTLFDLTGKKVLVKKNTSQLEVSKLSTGIYLLRVQDGNNVQTFKILKN